MKQRAQEGQEAGGVTAPVVACSGVSNSSANNESESDTCVDERALCTLVSRRAWRAACDRGWACAYFNEVSFC